MERSDGARPPTPPATANPGNDKPPAFGRELAGHLDDGAGDGAVAEEGCPVALDAEAGAEHLASGCDGGEPLDGAGLDDRAADHLDVPRRELGAAGLGATEGEALEAVLVGEVWRDVGGVEHGELSTRPESSRNVAT